MATPGQAVSTSSHSTLKYVIQHNSVTVVQRLPIPELVMGAVSWRAPREELNANPWLSIAIVS